MQIFQFPIVITTNQPVPFEEKVRDHNAILDAFLNTHITRNHSECTRKFDEQFLRGWFTGYRIQDPEKPNGRQLFVWEAMEPVTGAEIIQSYSTGLAATDLLYLTCTSYLGLLKRLFAYILDHPDVPTGSIRNPVQIKDKYNALVNPVSKYLNPPRHAVDTLADYPLVEEGMNEFLSWVNEEHLPRARNPLTAGRTYTQIITAAECGFRYCEIRGFDALKPTRDISLRGTIRTRCGKATNGSGPRTREVELTKLARATLEYYERRIRPGFPHANTNSALFLTGTGARVDYHVAKSALRMIVRKARADGLTLPRDMGWHSFRRSFATQFLHRYPDRIWDLLGMMGHQNFLSLIRYVRPSKEAVDERLERYVRQLSIRSIA